jgi:hypothetical protein
MHLDGELVRLNKELEPGWKHISTVYQKLHRLERALGGEYGRELWGSELASRAKLPLVVIKVSSFFFFFFF